MRRPSLVILTLMVASVSPAGAQTPGESPQRETLVSRVQNALRNSHVADAEQIEIEVKGDAVQLSGFVESEEDREKALMAARDVQGVGTVRNDLVVRDSHPTIGQALDDTIIAAQVRKQILAKIADAPDINVTVNDGVVQLSGYVANAEIKNRVADVASAVEGVEDVRNNIALEQP